MASNLGAHRLALVAVHTEAALRVTLTDNSQLHELVVILAALLEGHIAGDDLETVQDSLKDLEVRERLLRVLQTTDLIPVTSPSNHSCSVTTC